MYTLWVNYRKATFAHSFIVCRNIKQTEMSVNHVFVMYNVNSRKFVSRMVIYCSMIRIDKSNHIIVYDEICGVRGYQPCLLLNIPFLFITYFQAQLNCQTRCIQHVSNPYGYL